MNCVLAVTVEVSEEAKWVLKKIADQHSMVNMRINLDFDNLPRTTCISSTG